MSTCSSRPVRRLCAALLFLACAGTASAQFSVGSPMPDNRTILPPPGPTPVVQSVPFGPQDIVPGPGNDDRPNAHPNHPPIDQVPPMPMPKEGQNMPRQSESVIVHDSTNNQTWELPVVGGAAESASGPGYNGVDGFVMPPEMARNFGSMTPASNLSSFPASANVRLLMRFVDTNGANWYYVCSGAMQDAGMVMCAAHCTYFRGVPTGGSYPINNWAAEIWIYPAWDGVGNSQPNSTDVIQNFGWSHSTSYMAGTDYINSGNTDSDFGLVMCGHYYPERHVGMLTGWFGWGYDTSCSNNRGRPYYNFSYPAENCGGGLHTGRTMEIWSGYWDGCPNNQLSLSTSPGCYTAVWGGMSGSNAYWYDGTNRFAQAVCSTSNRSTSGYYCNMWPQWATDMNNQRPNVRGGGFDLEAFRYRLTGSTTIQATTATSSSVFLASNISNADPGSATFTYRVYLSTNDIISSGDTLLGTFTYTWDYAPLQNVSIGVPAVTIPNVSPGTYWLGVILDPGTDGASGNNDTSTWDAQQITVTAAPPPAPGNNNCANAYGISIGYTYAGTTTYATADGSSSCSGSGSPDVWYTFTAPYCGTVHFDTCGSYFDTVMSLHTGCPGSAGNQVACNDDSYSGGNNACGSVYPTDLQSGFDAFVTAGTTYKIRITSYSAAVTGNFFLTTYYLPPSNDNCSSAAAYTVGSTVGGCIGGATNDGQASCGASGTSGDVWYVMTPAASGYLRLDTCGSSFDTVLSVHTACPGNLGNQIACNDDSYNGGNGDCGTGAGILQSGVDLGVNGGSTYYIRVAAYGGNVGTGSFVIHSLFIPPPNDACANAITITPGATVTGVTTAATVDGSALCGNSTASPDVWYKLVATCSGTMHFDTCGSGYDTVLSLHTGCPGNTANQVACNDDSYSGGNNSCGLYVLQSGFDYNVVAGTTYYVRVAGYSGSTGAFQLHQYYLSSGSDACGSAPTVTDGSYVLCNCSATTDGPTEGLCYAYGIAVNNDLWFNYVAPFDGTVNATTCGSANPTFDTEIAVYAGGCPVDPDTAIACNDDNCSTLSNVTFNCVGGHNYLIRVGGYATSSRGQATLIITGHRGCGSADFNCDGDIGTDADIEAFFACLGGSCPPLPCTSSADFNGDGDIGTDADIEAFFRVLGGGTC